eukprot:109928-Hanusia_phi.AAC.1
MDGGEEEAVYVSFGDELKGTILYDREEVDPVFSRRRALASDRGSRTRYTMLWSHSATSDVKALLGDDGMDEEALQGVLSRDYHHKNLSVATGSGDQRVLLSEESERGNTVYIDYATNSVYVVDPLQLKIVSSDGVSESEIDGKVSLQVAPRRGGGGGGAGLEGGWMIWVGCDGSAERDLRVSQELCVQRLVLRERLGSGRRADDVPYSHLRFQTQCKELL